MCVIVVNNLQEEMFTVCSMRNHISVSWTYVQSETRLSPSKTISLLNALISINPTWLLLSSITSHDQLVLSIAKHQCSSNQLIHVHSTSSSNPHRIHDEDYVHRVGRTGRAGASGWSQDSTWIQDAESPMFKVIHVLNMYLKHLPMEMVKHYSWICFDIFWF